jgi:hypothetical protein
VEVIMAVTRFDGGGPVARYWLANCEGFVVQGGARGVVEELIRDADPHVTTRLVIRTRARRRRIISAGAVSEVVPADGVLIVSRPRARRRMRQQPWRLSAARVRVESVRVVGAVGRMAAVVVDRVASAGPPTRLALLAARRRLVLFANDAWMLARPALLLLAGSFRILAVESQATGRLLLRNGSRLIARLNAQKVRRIVGR